MPSYSPEKRYGPFHKTNTKVDSTFNFKSIMPSLALGDTTWRGWCTGQRWPSLLRAEMTDVETEARAYYSCGLRSLFRASGREFSGQVSAFVAL